MTILARARIILEGDTIRLTRSLRGAEAAMQQTGRRMSAIGKSLTTRVTLPILAVGVGAVKAFADFDNAMVQSLAIMGDVSQALRDDMAEAAKTVARETTTSATKAAESFFFLASAGLDAEQSIAALPQVARFAQAGMFDMATATDLATDAQSALGLTVKGAAQNLVNLTRVTDVLVRANTLANANVRQFAVALTSQAGAALKSFKIDIEEGVAVLAAFADQGIKAELAGNGLSRILRLMTAGAIKNKAAMKALGIEVFDLTTGKINNLGDIIADLENAFRRMSDEQRTVALSAIGFKARVQGIILPLLGTSKAIKRYERELRRANGTTKEIADKQLVSFTAQLKLTWNQVVLAFRAVGEVLVPALQRLSLRVRAAARAFEDLDIGTRRIIVVVAGLIAVLGPTVFLLGGMALGIAKLTVAMRLMLVPAAGVTRAMLLLRAVVSPGSLLIVGLGVLAVMFLRAQKAAAEAALAMAAANEKFEASLGLLDPKQAEKIAERLGVIIGRMKERIVDLNQQALAARATQGFLADQTRNVASAAIQAAEGTRLSAEALREQAAETQETVDQLERHERILLAVVAAGEELEDQEGGGGGDGGEGILALAEAMETLKESLATADRLSELLGDSFDLASERASALETGIVELIDAGAEFDAVVGPNGETLQELANGYLDLKLEIKKAEEAQEKFNAVEEEAKQIILSVMTPLEIYNAQYAVLKAHLDGLRISQEDFNRAVAQAEEVLRGAEDAAEDWGETVEDVASRALTGFLNFTNNADNAFRQFANNVISDLARISAALIASKIFDIIGNIGGAAAGGGSSGSTAQTAQLPGGQHGGFFPEGQLAVVGEAGPELIRPGRGGVTVRPLRGKDLSGAGGGGDGGARVELTINAVDARSFAELVEADPSAITEPFLRALHRSTVLGNAMRR